VAVVTELRRSWDQLAQAQKSGAGVPFYMRVVNRRLGRALACVGALVGATANQVTALSGLVALAGVALVAGVDVGLPGAVAALLLMQLAFALDSADGQLARLTGRGSPAGEWLDHVVDATRTLAFHGAILIALYRFTEVADAVLLVPLLFALVASVRFFAQILSEQLLRQRGGAAEESGTAVGALIQTPADVGVQNLVLLLLPWTAVFLAGYVLLAVANTLLLAATLVRRHRALVAPARVEV
jgi:phosphatidylglycerophosphate synthase